MKAIKEASKRICERLRPFRGITNDVKGRIPWYASDWHDGFSCGVRYIQ